MRVEPDNACLDVDVPPLEREYFAWNPPSSDVRELHGWLDRRRQMIQHAFDLFPLEEPGSTYGRFKTGMSPLMPQGYELAAAKFVLDVKMYQAPLDGRYTAMSAFPSPS